MHRGDGLISKTCPRIVDSFQLNLLLLVIEIVGQRTQRALSEQQIDLFQRELLRFLASCQLSPTMSKQFQTYLEHKPNGWQRNA